MRLALTGGIACGKSLVARFLNQFGVETIDADAVVHELLPDPAVRRRIAAEVFADPEKRRALEAKLHPLVKERINSFFQEGQRSKVKGQAGEDNKFHRLTSDLGPRISSQTSDLGSLIFRPRLAVIPLLFETHWDADYDIICCVTSDRETQVSRMLTTRGYTREEAEARLAAQMPVGEKAAKSHYVIENSGSTEELKSKVAEFVGWLKRKWQTNSMFSQVR